MNTEIEHRIIAAINAGKTQFTPLMCHLHSNGLEQLHYRVLDRALQSMRRRGLIEYRNQRDGWAICPPPIEGEA